jgi:hypothetical protein
MKKIFKEGRRQGEEEWEMEADFVEVELREITILRLIRNFSEFLFVPRMVKFFRSEIHNKHGKEWREHVGFNNSVFLSEKDTAHRNFCLGHMMMEAKAFPPETGMLPRGKGRGRGRDIWAEG